MPLGDGSTWDEANPQQSTLANTIDSYNRDIRTGTRLRMANEHIWPSSQTGSSQAGQHVYISLQAQTAVPSMPVVASVTQAGMIFMSTGGLVFQNSAGTVVTLLSSGATGLNIGGGTYSATGTIGDLLIGTGTGTIRTLAASADGFILQSHTNTGNPTWIDPATLGYMISSTNNLRILFGSGAVSGGSNAAVNFSTAFSTTPFVVVSPVWLPSPGSDENAGMVSAASIGASGFTVYNTDNTNKSYTYMAIGSK